VVTWLERTRSNYGGALAVQRRAGGSDVHRFRSDAAPGTGAWQVGNSMQSSFADRHPNSLPQDRQRGATSRPGRAVLHGTEHGEHRPDLRELTIHIRDL
jgi:hypothetical protein